MRKFDLQNLLIHTFPSQKGAIKLRIAALPVSVDRPAGILNEFRRTEKSLRLNTATYSRRVTGPRPAAR